MAAMFRGAKSQKLTFPSGVFLFDDGAGKRVLFDTGYAADQWKTGIAGFIYRRLLPPKISRRQTAAAQLMADGVEPASITHIVLSHLHPDHIGGLRDFAGATLIMTQGQQRTLRKPALREGILAGLLPEFFDDAECLILGDDDFDDVRVGSKLPVTLRGKDVWGDGRMIIIDLPGHARGHIGALVDGKVLLAGDAAWGEAYFAHASRMQKVPRLIQHDYPAYVHTNALLTRVQQSGIRVICSHDTIHDKVIL